MQSAQKISFNFSIKLLASLLGGGVSFLFSLCLMRKLDPSLFGQYSLALGWASFFCALADFGLNPIISRDLAQYPSRGPIYGVVIARAKTFLVLIAGAALAVFSIFYLDARLSTPLVMAAYLGLAAVSVSETLYAFFYAFGQFVPASFFSLTQKVLMAGAGIIALYAGFGLGSVVVTSAIGAWGGTVGGLFYLHRFLKRVPSVDLPDHKSITQFMSEAFPLFIAALMGILYFRIDTIFLGHMTTDFETGLYSTAYRFFEVTNVVPSVFVAVMQPELAKGVSNNTIDAVFKRGLKWMIFLAAGTWIIAQAVPTLMPYLLKNAKYMDSGFLFRVLSVTIIPLFLNYYLLTALTVLKKQKQAAYVVGAGLVFNVIANIFVIPNWRAFGASMTTLVSEIFVMSLCFVLLRGEFKRLHCSE